MIVLEQDFKGSPHEETLVDLAKNHFKLPLGKIVVVSHGQANQRVPYPTRVCQRLDPFFSSLFFSFLFLHSLSSKAGDPFVLAAAGEPT